MTLKPYYSEKGITIYHGDCRHLLPSMPQSDLVLTDPPYGVNKAEWGLLFAFDWLAQCAAITRVIAVMPGISNLAAMPDMAGFLRYRWTLAILISNGMTRGASVSGIGFLVWSTRMNR